MPRKRSSVKRHPVVQPQNESYRLIPLTQGKNAIVDIADFEWLNQWNWIAWKSLTGHFYARRWADGEHISMHRLILGLDDGEMGNHKNENSLDNRRENLRECDSSKNVCNRGLRSDNKTGYKGVYPCNSGWRARIRLNGKGFHIGCFRTPQEAAIAYNQAAERLFGEFAKINQIVPPEPDP